VKFENKNVLLFDLDGTLVDSAPDLALAVNQTLTQLKRSPFDQSIIRNWVGNGALCLISRALSGSKDISPELTSDVIDQALTLFLAYYQNCVCIESVLYDGVKDTLVTLKSRGYRLAIITNKPEVFIQPILQGLGLTGLFELQLGGDSLPERKPHPMPLFKACEQLDVDAAQCVMIGDSKNDILAAKSANIDSIGLTYGYNYDEDLAIHQPTYLFNHFNKLLEVLEGVNELA
jgi:phosphoglycolate phosphatase